MSAPDIREARKRFRPVIGRSVPTDLVRLLVAIVLLSVSILIVGFVWWLAIAVLLVVATMAFPRSPAAWGLSGLLAVFALGAANAGPTWKSALALASVHALYQFALMLSWLPDRGRVQLRILGRMLRTYLIIQIPAQIAAFAILTLLSGTSAAATLISPAFGLAAGIALVVLVALVVIPQLRSARDAD